MHDAFSDIDNGLNKRVHYGNETEDLYAFAAYRQAALKASEPIDAGHRHLEHQTVDSDDCPAQNPTFTLTSSE